MSASPAAADAVDWVPRQNVGDIPRGGPGTIRAHSTHTHTAAEIDDDRAQVKMNDANRRARIILCVYVVEDQCVSVFMCTHKHTRVEPT